MAGEAHLEFEKPIIEIELQIQELKEINSSGVKDLTGEIQKLQKRLHKLHQEIFSNLSPWQKTQMARHPNRPYTMDYIGHMADSFFDLHGGRRFGDDQAIVGGLLNLNPEMLIIIGHQKGRNTKQKLLTNFGMPNPEGYRKALRLMKLAEKFKKPILTLIDTPGAYPGIGAEERGQAEAIAENLRVMSGLRVPIIAVVTGEGGSGGALALGVGDRVLMMEHAVYSVISPESCAAILWRDKSKAPDAAEPLKLTAKDASELGVIDEIITEPFGGAHKDHALASAKLKEAVQRHLEDLKSLPIEILLQKRYNKFRKIGSYREN
jgi:acetyl-CoA carboxylase carboxyl transferase subunit alpha